MPDPEQIIAQKRQRMHAIEAQYLRTKEFLKSSEWAVRRDDVLIQLSATMALYKAGTDAIGLGVIFGAMKQIMLLVQQVTDVIVEYESLQNEINRYDERTG